MPKCITFKTALSDDRIVDVTNTAKASNSNDAFRLLCKGLSHGHSVAYGAMYEYDETYRSPLNYAFIPQNVPLQWSGPEVILVNLFHRGTSTGSLLSSGNTPSGGIIKGDSNDAIKLQNGYIFTIDDVTNGGFYPTFFITYNTEVRDMSGAIIVQSPVAFDKDRVLSENTVYNLFGSIRVPLSSISAKELVSSNDIPFYPETKSSLECELHANLSTKKWISSTKYLYYIPHDIVRGSINLRQSISGQAIPNWITTRPQGSGALILGITGGVVPSEPVSNWTGYVDISGWDINGNLKLNESKAVTIKFSYNY